MEYLYFIIPLSLWIIEHMRLYAVQLCVQIVTLILWYFSYFIHTSIHHIPNVFVWDSLIRLNILPCHRLVCGTVLSNFLKYKNKPGKQHFLFLHTMNAKMNGALHMWVERVALPKNQVQIEYYLCLFDHGHFLHFPITSSWFVHLTRNIWTKVKDHGNEVLFFRFESCLKSVPP